jgi:hypothetical protein
MHFRAFSFRQNIPKLSRFSAIQTGLTFAHDFDHPETVKSESNRVCRRGAKLIANLRGVTVAEEVYLAAA